MGIGNAAEERPTIHATSTDSQRWCKPGQFVDPDGLLEPGDLVDNAFEPILFEEFGLLFFELFSNPFSPKYITVSTKSRMRGKGPLF
jgi:hypothetical protein